MREERKIGLSKIEFKIGTSGYSYWDWRGKFYPPDIKGSDMLSYYKDHFDCVEINSTHYRILYSSTFRKMLSPQESYWRRSLANLVGSCEWLIVNSE